MAWPVLLLARELDLGGSERQMTEIAKTLDRSRFIPHVGCFRPQGIRNAELAARGVPIVHFPVDSFASFGAISQAWRLADYIRQQGIRLVHTFDYPTTLFAVPVARLGTRAVVVSSQRSHRSLIPRKYLRWIRMTDRMSDAIVVNCEFVGRHLRKTKAFRARGSGSVITAWIWTRSSLAKRSAIRRRKIHSPSAWSARCGRRRI